MKLKQIETQAAQAEKDIARLEAEVAEHERQLGDFKSVEETMRVSDALDAARTQLTAKLAEWEDLTQSLEAMA